MTEWYPFRKKGDVYVDESKYDTEKISIDESGPYSMWEGCPKWCMSLAKSCNPKHELSIYDDLPWNIFWKKMAWFSLFLILFLFAVKYVAYVVWKMSL